MLDTSPGSAFATTGSAICHVPSCFLSVVLSPLADFTRISSILSACSDANTFSFFVSASLSGFFQVTK